MGKFSIASSPVWFWDFRYFTWLQLQLLLHICLDQDSGNEQLPAETCNAPLIVSSFGCFSGLHHRLLFLRLLKRERSMFAQKRTKSLRLRHTRAHFYTNPPKKKKKKISQTGLLLIPLSHGCNRTHMGVKNRLLHLTFAFTQAPHLLMKVLASIIFL